MAEVLEIQNAVAVPMAKAQAGHVAAYLAHSDDGTRGASIFVFETREQAEAFAGAMNLPPEAPIHLESLEVFEVTASG